MTFRTSQRYFKAVIQIRWNLRSINHCINLMILMSEHASLTLFGRNCYSKPDSPEDVFIRKGIYVSKECDEEKLLRPNQIVSSTWLYGKPNNCAVCILISITWHIKISKIADRRSKIVSSTYFRLLVRLFMYKVMEKIP